MTVGADVPGAEVVVVLDAADVATTASEIARRAPAAVVLVATPDAERDCATVLDVSLLPRHQVVGIPTGDVAAAVEAVVFGRELALHGAALCRGELGIEDRVATVPLRLGAGGVRRIG